MTVPGNHPLAEVLAKCLSGIETVPAAEQRKMVSRAAREAVAWHDANKGAASAMSPADATVQILNELLANDPAAIQELLFKRVPVSAATADHEHIVVNAEWELGGIGVINGILSLLRQGHDGHIVCAVIDDKATPDRVTGFRTFHVKAN